VLDRAVLLHAAPDKFPRDASIAEKSFCGSVRTRAVSMLVLIAALLA